MSAFHPFRWALSRAISVSALFSATLLLQCASGSGSGDPPGPGDPAGGDSGQGQGGTNAGSGTGPGDPSDGGTSNTPDPEAGAGGMGPPDPNPPGGAAGTPGEPPVIDPPEGGEGCGPDSLCRDISDTYAELIGPARSCSSGAPNACSVAVPMHLGCGGCPVWVNAGTELESLAEQFEAAGCRECAFGEPGGTCIPTICPDTYEGVCSMSGMCENRDPVCPANADGMSCSGEPNYCQSGGTYCVCFDGEWSCF